MGKIFILVAAILVLCVSVCNAGCYKDKSLKKQVPKEQWYHNHKPAPHKPKNGFPRKFDWCDNEGVNYCTPSWNQHIPYYCGACWAHASLSMIQDRLKIQKNAEGPDVMLGRQTLLNCAALEGYGSGCDGGDPIDVFRYMANHGLPDEGCVPYNATDHTKYPGAKHCPAEAKCMNCMPTNDVDFKCWSIAKPVMYYLTSFGHLDAVPNQSMEDTMMAEILHRGPITCGIACPDRFVYNYHGGIFKDDYEDKELDHDIEIVGWGEERGEKYWVVRNSWGAYWGELGFFRIQRGVNALQIESGDCWYAVPEHKVENLVARGKKVGSMYGLEAPNASVSDVEEATGVKVVLLGAERKHAGAAAKNLADKLAAHAHGKVSLPELKRAVAAAAAAAMQEEGDAVLTEDREAIKLDEARKKHAASRKDGGRKAAIGAGDAKIIVPGEKMSEGSRGAIVIEN